MCPDFAAEHADISTGGIGAFGDWTLAVIRTPRGKELVDAMLADGVIEIRPGEDDPGALALLDRLARASRRRWPDAAAEAPGRIPVTA
jgi:coenzyme F420 hydrogenase subunit beta